MGSRVWLDGLALGGAAWLFSAGRFALGVCAGAAIGWGKRERPREGG